MKARIGRIVSTCFASSTARGILLLVGLMVWPESSYGSRFFWVAGASLGQWNNQANWSGEGLPGLSDEATLSGGHAFVEHARVGSLILFGHLNSGRLEVVENAYISNSILSHAHQLVMEPGTRTTYDGLNPMRITDNSQIINHGVFEVFANGPLQFETGGSFLNETPSQNDPTAQFIVQFDPALASEYSLKETAGSNSRFFNRGAEFINRSLSGKTSIDLEFHNNGVVFAELGPIVFNKGGLHTLGAFLTQDTNEVVFAKGDHVFELDQGDIRMGKGIVWSGGDFRLQKIGGKIDAQGLRIRNPAASLRGAGLIEVDDLLFDPAEEGSSLRILDAVELVTRQFATFKSANGTVLVDGKLRFKSPGVVLHKGSKLVNRSTGEIRFEGDAAQTIRDVDGVSRIENDGDVRFLSKATNVLIPVINRGQMEFEQGFSEFTKDFDSDQGGLKIKGSAALKLQEKVALGEGATIENKGNLNILAKNPIRLAGKFEGAGTIEFTGDKSMNVEGEAQFSGPKLDFRKMGQLFRSFPDINFAVGTQWTVSPSSDDFANAWIFGDGGHFIGPGTIQNISNDLTWTFHPSGISDFHMGFSAVNMTINNDGYFELASGNKGNIGIRLKDSTIENSGTLVLGTHTSSFVIDPISGSRIINRKGALITLVASESFFFNQPASKTSAVQFQNDGEIRVEQAGSQLVLKMNSRHNGAIVLNGGRFIMEDGTQVFGPDSTISTIGTAPTSIDANNIEWVIEDDLEYNSVINFTHVERSQPGVLKVPILGKLQADSLNFNYDATRTEPAVIITMPDNFFPKAHEGKSFTVLEANQITGLRKELIAITNIPGQDIEYSIDIQSNALRIGVLSVSDEQDSGFEESFDLWTKEKFQAEETQTKPEDDPDGDGKTNLHEYGIGSDPTLPDNEGLKVEFYEEGGELKVRLVYPKSTEAKGVDVEVEQSDSLMEPFQPINPDELEPPNNTPFSNDPTRIKVHFPILPKRNTARFFRLNIKVQNVKAP